MTINQKVLERFLDDNGRVKQMPSKYEKKLNVLYYLASKFECGKLLTELEVNQKIEEWINFEDYVTIRRFLIDMRFLERSSNGKEYHVNEFEIN